MNTLIHDAGHLPVSRVDRLRQDADQAAQVRALTTHPDVIALRVEKVRAQVDGLIWAGLLLGLAFTMVNVQTFAAAGAVVWSLAWCAAWLLDPMVSLVLIAVLRAEQITARYQVETGTWVRRTKVFAFAATFTMNTWQSWTGLNPAGIVLHSVPPTLVYLAAETGPILRDRLTEAVLRAVRLAPIGEPVHESPAEQSAPAVRERRPRMARMRSAKPRRKLLADYLDEARQAYTPETVVTPAWVRSVTSCARGTSKNVADALNRELSENAAAEVTA
jgi:hypothetical protein